MTSGRDNQTGSGGLILAAGASLLMAFGCALPLLISGGALAGLGGFLGNPWALGAGLTLLVLAAGATTRCDVLRRPERTVPRSRRGHDRASRQGQRLCGDEEPAARVVVGATY